VDYINAQYDGGANAGKYLYFRISPSKAPSTYKGGVFATSENANPALRPILELGR
jgi:hypothetical protein